MSQTLQKGDDIPLFKLHNQNNTEVNISDFVGKKNIVIYFYPKANTKVCTAQACSFRDAYGVFSGYDCIVFGISSDSVSKQLSFQKNNNLPFDLLADTQNKVRKLFKVPKDFLGLISGRYTYVIDKKGKIQLVFNSAFNANKHIEAALEILKKKHE